MEHIQVSGESDIERLRALKADWEKRYTTYSEIVKTYYEISQGDYISKLVEQKRQKRENINCNKSL